MGKVSLKSLTPAGIVIGTILVSIGFACGTAWLVRQYGDPISGESLRTNLVEDLSAVLEKKGQSPDHAGTAWLADTLALGGEERSHLEQLLRRERIPLHGVVTLADASHRTFPDDVRLTRLLATDWRGEAFLAVLAGLSAGLLLALIQIQLTAERTKKISQSLDELVDRSVKATIGSPLVAGSFQEVLHRFFRVHEKILTDVYRGYPQAFMERWKTQGSFNEYCERDGDRSRSISIWACGVEVRHYAKLAIELLSVAERQVFSTTYFDNELFLSHMNVAPNATTDSVPYWLTRVRAAVRASREDSSTPDLKVVRVHVFLDEKGRKDFVRRLKNPEDAIANGVRQYRDLYTDPDICLYRVDWCDKGIRFFGG